MNFELEPLPENADTILGALHGDFQAAVNEFEAKASAILADHNQRPVQRASALDFARRDAVNELGDINKSLSIELQDFTKRIRELQRHRPVSGDSLQRYQEARAVLRAAATAKRKTMLENATKTKDSLLLQAVIDGPGYLSGLSDKEHVDFAEQARATLHGDESRELEQARLLANELLELVEKARAYINSFGTENRTDAV